MAYKHNSSYAIEIRSAHKALKRTLDLYRNAVTYLLTPVIEHWNEVAVIKGSNQRMNYIESIVHNTKVHKASYDFDDRFYKFPSYLRRSAIVAAIGAVASYKSNYENWLKAGSNGKEPAFSYDRHQCPALYRGDMFKWDMNGNALIKVYENNDWVWRELSLRKTDVSYFEKRTAVNNICKFFSPILEKKHGKYFLRFALKEEVELSDRSIYERKVCAVDLGLNTDATCSVIDVHGTVLSRRFINCGIEKDYVKNALHRVSVFQRLHGSHDVQRLWSVAERRNHNLANLVAHDIVEFARECGCDVIVFEYLDTRGKKRGSKKQRLTMWKHRDIQNTAESLAHKYGMRVSHVNAWNTSKLAYDGSGIVKRGRAVSQHTPYDVCRFSNGKMYNCDLSASYNIGARYFIRELIKEIPGIQAEVPDIGSGTRRTLSDLWRINDAIVL